ncbi:MAG: ABC transporter substrate-binding protein [Daejeonella sp.]|uniref:ABC transporter substrate-binding protein n=1 Tax=Daejeonella sp. TaxID=2805397 RepID=UPI003C7136E7
MILVPSRLLRSNGSRCLLILSLLVAVSGCSKRIIPAKTGTVKTPPVVKPREEVPPVKRDIDHSIALLLPFELNTIDLRTAGTDEIRKSHLAVDFYLGFKLALDSLSRNGHNYRLQVLDTQDQEARIVNLAAAASVKENEIIVGPIFPDAIGAFSDFFEKSATKLIVSPLAASMPSQFDNPNLVTVNNSVDQHGWKIAEYITKNYKPEQVNIVLINTKKSDDEKFAAPIRKFIAELSNGKFAIVERPNGINLQSYLSTSKNNLVILSSDDRMFIVPIIDRLSKLSNENYRVELFGHPNWVKADFLDGSKMQTLKTKLSSSYFVNYKTDKVRHFIARYRDEYGFEPSEYSFKGFDIGYYFGSMLQKYGKNYAGHLTQESYTGLHNSFRFTKEARSGYRNTELMMLTYRALELQMIK